MTNGRRRRRSLVSLFSVACAAAFALQPVAQAAEPTAPEPTAETHHAMGSQIRKHEGGQADAQPNPNAASVLGMDVSGWQGHVDWQAWWNEGARFAYIKATESTSYTSPDFAHQYNGSYNQGMIRGAYHFALPDRSSGAAQANFFVDNGGGWSADGKTLPGALDMEYNPYGATCYGMSGTALTNWVADFSNTYHARTGRYPAIYTSTSWWNQCGLGDFSSTSPLWIARYADSPGALPGNWGFHTFWQYTSSPLDLNLFNGAYDRLQALANG